LTNGIDQNKIVQTGNFLKMVAAFLSFMFFYFLKKWGMFKGSFVKSVFTFIYRLIILFFIAISASFSMVLLKWRNSLNNI